MKTKASSTAMRAERNDFDLPALVWFVFRSVNIITQHHVLIETADAIVHFSRFKHMQYRAPGVGKMKIEPAMISFLDNTTSSKMADQTGDFFEKENWNSVSDGHATPCIEVSYIV